MSQEADDSSGSSGCGRKRRTSSSGTGPKVKRKRRRERMENPCPMDVVLPPCRICDEKSSGLHYGVNSCEACKVRNCLDLHRFIIHTLRYLSFL